MDLGCHAGAGSAARNQDATCPAHCYYHYWQSLHGVHFDLAITFWFFLQNLRYIWWFTWKRPWIHIRKACTNWWKQNLASTCIGTYGDNLVTEDFKISSPALVPAGQRDAQLSTVVATSVPRGIAIAMLEFSNWRTWHKLGRQAPSQCCQVTFSLINYCVICNY